MARKLPSDAFLAYVALGNERSYQKIAEQYGTTKRTVTRLAVQENWSERLDHVQRQSRERVDKDAVETLDAMNERHAKLLRFITGKALETLRAAPIAGAREAVQALALVLREERNARGDGGYGGRGEIESIVRREYEQWFAPESDASIDNGGSDGR